MKNIEDMGEYKFKKDYSLLSNLKYYMRRFARQAKKHYEQKEIETNLAQKVFHGVSGSHELRFARMLRTIIKEVQKISLPLEARVMRKPAGKKEFSMKEILISALAEMEKKLYMVLLKNGKKFEYYDSDFENTDFDEYTLDEHYDPDRGINIIEMRKP